MNKRWPMTMLAGAVAVAILWKAFGGETQVSVSQEDATPRGAHVVQPLQSGATPSALAEHRSPLSRQSSESTTSPLPAAMADPGEEDNPADLVSLPETEEVQDTGDYIDADAETPSQDVESDSPPQDTGRFIDADEGAE